MIALQSSKLGIIMALCVLSVSSTVHADCPSDLNSDNLVNAADLALLLGAWGSNNGDPADINSDDVVNAADLALLLGAWGPCIALELIQIPSGESEIGCHDHYEPLSCLGAELPVHTVFISTFYMSVFEVTNQQYAVFLNSAYAEGQIEVTNGVVYKMGDSELYCRTNSANSNSRIHWDGSTFTVTGQELPADDLGNKTQHPMIEVGWFGAVAYVNWLSVQNGRTPCYDLETWICDFDADGYRLPTEAEWEYAARGGLNDPYVQFPWGDDLDGSKSNHWQSGDAWEATFPPKTTPVGYYDGGQIPAGVDMINGYGLHDMGGNVREWCNDWYDSSYYSSSPYDNPQGPTTGSRRVIRGGTWCYCGSSSIYLLLRNSFRVSYLPDFPTPRVGFRVARGA